MATKPANYVATIAGYASATERHDIMHNATIIITGAPVTIFVMEARDSVTSGLFHWISMNGPDFTGTGYPGPNSPTNIAISQVRDTVG
jgi:hypothetical protein